MERQIRDLNLSYNILQFRDDNPGDPNHIHSIAAFENLISLFRSAKVLNHVNFSGMNITGERLIQFTEELTNVTMIMGVHLNDCEINRNIDILTRMLQLFDLTLEDIPKERQEMDLGKVNYD